MRTFEQKIEHRTSQSMSVIDMFLVDKETGKTVSDDEVERAFNELTAVGYMVKSNYDVELPTDLPHFGMVREITDETVQIGGADGKTYEVKRELFHTYYQLD